MQELIRRATTARILRESSVHRIDRRRGSLVLIYDLDIINRIVDLSVKSIYGYKIREHIIYVEYQVKCLHLLSRPVMTGA